MRPLLSASLFLFLCGLALDYRSAGEGGPSIAQYLFLTLSFAGGLGVIICGMVLSRGRIAVGSRFGLRLLLITLAFCAWAPVAVVISSDTPHSDFLSVFLPYLLYGQSVLATLLALQVGVQERTIIRTLLTVSAISCAWRLVYAVTLGGVELSSARWQILSPALPLILGASVAALNTRTNRPLAVFGIVYFLTIVTLSITRGYLVGLAFVLFATVVATRGRGRALIAGKTLSRMALVVISIGMSISLLTLVLPDDVGDRWLSRLSGEKADSGQEITLLYRLAQFKGQYDELTTSTATMVAGRGFGARYVFDEGLLSALEFISADEVKESTNGSDSTWGYPIFAHGLVFGPLFLGAFLATVLLSVRNCRALQATGPANFPVYFVCFSLAALLGISLTGNIFGERFGGVIIGAVVAMGLKQGERRWKRGISGCQPAASNAIPPASPAPGFSTP